MVSIVLEEVATADLFRTIALDAMDVMDVNRIEVDVVGPKLAGEEDKKMLLLLVMMLQLMSMVHLLTKVMVLLLRVQLTMNIPTMKVAQLLLMPMVPLLRIVMVLQKDLLTMKTMVMFL